MIKKILPICLLLLLGACGNDDEDTPTTTPDPVITEVQSNCEDSDGTLRSQYLEKAQLLAVRYTLEQNPNDTIAVISSNLVDEILTVFYAINQANDLKNTSDALILKIYPYPSLYTVNVFVDKDSNLGQTWKDNFSTTNNDTINQLLIDYGLTVTNYNTDHASGHKITLKTSTAYNTQVIVDEFIKIQDVKNANNEEITSVTDDIQYSIEGTNKILKFIDRKVGGSSTTWKYQVSDSCVVKKI